MHILHFLVRRLPLFSIASLDGFASSLEARSLFVMDGVMHTHLAGEFSARSAISCCLTSLDSLLQMSSIPRVIFKTLSFWADFQCAKTLVKHERKEIQHPRSTDTRIEQTYRKIRLKNFTELISSLDLIARTKHEIMLTIYHLTKQQLVFCQPCETHIKVALPTLLLF